MNRVQISEDVVIDTDEIALIKHITNSNGEFVSVEVVMRGDKQIYAYGGDGGKILWNILSSAAFPAYDCSEKPNDDPPF